MSAEPAEGLKILSATERDVAIILSFIRKLAEYEKLSHQVAATEELLRDTLFGERRVAEVLIAYLAGRTGWICAFLSQLLDFPGASRNLS